jgi:hypothetical protein
LGEGDDFGVGSLGTPGAAVDEFVLEVAEVCNGTTEAGAAETKEDEEDLG